MLVMANKRKPGRPPKGDKPTDRSKSRHVSPRLAFHLSKALHQAFLNWLEEQEPQPDQSEALRAALRLFLQARGKWPPKS